MFELLQGEPDRVGYVCAAHVSKGPGGAKLFTHMVRHLPSLVQGLLKEFPWDYFSKAFLRTCRTLCVYLS